MQFSDSHDNSEITTVTTLEIYCDEKNISEIDYLKVDAEGYDKLVLEGLNWSKICPRLIMCEYEDRKTIQLYYTKDYLINFLTDKGYHIILSVWKPIISYGGAHRWQQILLSDFATSTEVKIRFTNLSPKRSNVRSILLISMISLPKPIITLYSPQ